MKKILLSLLLTATTLSGFSTVWTVVNSGFSFSPANITVNQGDTILFSLGNIHTVVEVSQATWNANGNTSNGGFTLPLGGGQLFTGQLSAGTHWYVCQPHASMGMKGTINVQPTTGLNDVALHSMSSSPNVFTTKIVINNSMKADAIAIYNLIGNKIYSNAVGDDEQIEFSGSLFSAGTYVYRLTKSGRVIQTTRFVKL